MRATGTDECRLRIREGKKDAGNILTNKREWFYMSVVDVEVKYEA